MIILDVRVPAQAGTQARILRDAHRQLRALAWAPACAGEREVFA